MFFERFQCCRFRVVGHLKVWEFSKVNVEGLRVLASRSIWTARQHWGGFRKMNAVLCKNPNIKNRDHIGGQEWGGFRTMFYAKIQISRTEVI